MAINFPGSLDNFTNPTSASPINSPSHADQHANANDAIEALEAKVGVDGSSVVTSHDYKIAQLQSLVTSAVAGAKSIYQDVRNQSGSAFTKATPVYVSGSTGASGQLLVSAASNATEATSSKTMGITTSAISNNSNGQVISEGILEGIDTTGAADGDPVWLGVNGAKIYGLANKPSAPAHLVFLGIVIRGGQANTGSMYVKIQNGFELHELHNVEVSSLVNGNILAYDSTTQTWKNTNTIQSTASTVPLVVKASASQTANLTQWQDSGGNVLTRVQADGTISWGTGGSALQNSSGRLIVNPSSASAIAVIVKGATSQTANLQEWQNSSGTVLASVIAGGSIRGFAGLYGANSANSSVNPLFVVNSVAANVVAVIKGAASQTANLQEWQDSAGTVLASIWASGTFATAGRIAVGNGSTGAKLDIMPASTTQVGVTIKANASQTANLQEWQSDTGTVLSKVTSSGRMDVSGLTVIGNAYASGVVLALFVGTGTSQVPLASRGSSTQTANLQEWQNSAGTVLARVSSGGAFVTSAVGVFGAQSNTPNAQLYVLANSITLPTFVAKATASQTGNLTEWQDSTGTVLSYITASGALRVNSAFGGTQAAITAGSAATVGLIVRGAASQTADLQQWQNSAGTVLTSIFPSGNISIGTTQAGVHGQANSQGVVTTETAPLIVRGSAPGQNMIELWAYGKDAYITGAVGNGTSVTYTTSIAHGFTTSDYVTVNGIIGNPGSGTLNMGGGATVSAVTTYTFTLPNTTTQTYISGGYARNAQYPGNILQAYRSDGMSLFTIGSSGGFAMADVMSVANVGYQQAGISVQPNLTSSAAIRMYGRSAQTAEILDVRNYIYKSGGSDSIFAIIPDYSVSANADGYGAWVRMRNSATPTANPTSAGYLYVNNGALNYMGTSGLPQQIIGADGTVKFTAVNTTSQVLIVKGIASQSGDLQQWRNSADTVLAKIDSSGTITSSAKTLYLDGGSLQFGYGGGASSGNLAMGTNALANNTTGNVNVAIGAYASQLNTTGGYNISIGTGAGYSNNTGNGNTAIGASSLNLNTSSDNTALAILALYSNTTGVGNTGLGSNALLNNTTGSYNIGIGRVSGASFTTGNYNTVVGSMAFYNATSTGSNNTGIGYGVGGTNTGSNNVFIGYLAGSQETGSNKLYIANSNTSTPLIGGDFSTNALTISGNVNINSQSASIVPLIIQHASSPSSNYFEIRNSAGNPVWGINSAGESLTRTTTKYGANIQNDSNNNNTALSLSAPSTSGSGIALYVYSGSTTRDMVKFDNSGVVKLTITSDGSLKGGNSNTISVNTASTVDTVALSSFTSMEYTLSIKQGSKIRSSKILVHTDGTSVDSTEYGIMEMGGGITGILVTASVSSTNAILQVTITDAATTNATVKLIKTML